LLYDATSKVAIFRWLYSLLHKVPPHQNLLLNIIQVLCKIKPHEGLHDYLKMIS